MKIKLVIAGVLLSFFLYECASTPKPITYDIPSFASAAEKEEIIKECEKGKVIFQTYCSKCHGIFTKGKKDIPNFSVQELTLYRMRTLKQDPTNHEDTKNISPEQLDKIVFFFMYKTKTTTQPPQAHVEPVIK